MFRLPDFLVVVPVFTAPKSRFSQCEWEQLAASYREKVEQHTLPTRKRRDCGTPHPVEDFLFEYYPYPLTLLERWQPGYGTCLEWTPNADSPAPPVPFTERYYTYHNGVLYADPRRLTVKERDRLTWINELLIATADRAANFSCFGMHEWAMVYRGREVRHEKTTPLRLPQAEIDAFVESRSICCSHHDAFRFFAEEAKPMNRVQPSFDQRVNFEQPGCVHANMDLYKWSAKSMPWIGSDLFLACFETAMELRDLDMRASPYDLSAWGRPPIYIETVSGRREYELEQRRLAKRSTALRARVIAALEATLAHATAGEISQSLPAQLLSQGLIK